MKTMLIVMIMFFVMISNCYADNNCVEILNETINRKSESGTFRTIQIIKVCEVGKSKCIVSTSYIYLSKHSNSEPASTSTSVSCTK